MKRILLTALIILSATTTVFADNFNSISIQGQLTSSVPITGVQVHILSAGAVVGTASDISLLPDADGVFSAQTYITNPWVFQTGSDYTMRLSTGTSPITVVSTFAITAVPFALTVRGDAQTGNQNIFGAYGNVGIGTSAPAYRLHITSAPGTSGDMVVVSTGTSNVIRMTGAGEIYANKYYGDISGATGLPSGDNLGNHTATTHLLMAGNHILNANAITASGYISANTYQINGATVLKAPNTSLGVGIGAGGNGSNNVFVGPSAGAGNSNGFSNTFIGYEAGQGVHGADIYNGNGNTGIGQRAGAEIYDGSWNTYIGVDSGMSAYNGSGDACVGAFSCSHAASAGGNTVLGSLAGENFTSGSNNVYIGKSAANNMVSGGSNIVIGANQSLSSTDASSELNIGGVIFGNLSAKTIGISTRVPQAALDVVSTGTANNQFAQIWRASDGIKSSMSATGVMMAAKFIGDGSGLTGLPADNLGNHIATAALNMAGYNINSIGNMDLHQASFSQNVAISFANPSQLGGVYISSNIYIVGVASATKYYGDGSSLTGVAASGAVQKTGDTMAGQLTITGSTLTVTGKDANGYSLSLSSGINMPAGTVTAESFNGSGVSLTALNAANLASGIVADDRLSPNVDLLDANKTVSGNKTFTGTVVLPTRDKIAFGDELHNSSSTMAAWPIVNYTTTQRSGLACATAASLTINTNGDSRVQVNANTKAYSNTTNVTIYAAYMLDAVVSHPMSAFSNRPAGWV